MTSPASGSLVARRTLIALTAVREQPGRGSEGGQEPRVIIKFRPQMPEGERAALHRRLGHHLDRVIPQLGIHAVRVPSVRSAEDVMARYRRHPLLAFVEAETFAEPTLRWHIGLGNRFRVGFSDSAVVTADSGGWWSALPGREPWARERLGFSAVKRRISVW